MTQEDKDILIKDLCARLPYQVKASYYGAEEECECVDTIDAIYRVGKDRHEVVIGQYGLPVEKVKPYLFPLSSMTDEKKYDFYCRFIENDCDFDDFKEFYINNSMWYKLFTSFDDIEAIIDWFNKNHIDYRGLIPMGLAIDATGLDIY